MNAGRVSFGYNFLDLWILSPLRAGAADPLGWDAHLRSTPTLAPPPRRSSGGGLPRGRARSCCRARVHGLFPPVPLSPAAARGRVGVWWARSRRLLRVPAEAAAAGAAEAAESTVPLPVIRFWPWPSCGRRGDVTRQYGKYGGGKGVSSPSPSRSRAPPGSGREEWKWAWLGRPSPAGATAHLLSRTGRALGRAFRGT